MFKHPKWKVLPGDEVGQGLTEYLILMLLIAIISIGAVKSLGGIIKEKLGVAKENIRREVTLEDK